MGRLPKACAFGTGQKGCGGRNRREQNPLYGIGEAAAQTRGQAKLLMEANRGRRAGKMTVENAELALGTQDNFGQAQLDHRC